MHPMRRIAVMLDALRAYVEENRRLPPEFQMHVNALHDEADQQEGQRDHQMVRQTTPAGEESPDDDETVSDPAMMDADHEESPASAETPAIMDHAAEDQRPTLTRPEASQEPHEESQNTGE